MAAGSAKAETDHVDLIVHPRLLDFDYVRRSSELHFFEMLVSALTMKGLVGRVQLIWAAVEKLQQLQPGHFILRTFQKQQVIVYAGYLPMPRSAIST